MPTRPPHLLQRFPGSPGGLTRIGDMGQALSQAGRKALALVVLLVAAFVLFKIVVGFVTGLLWIAVVVLAVVAVIWALRVL